MLQANVIESDTLVLTDSGAFCLQMVLSGSKPPDSYIFGTSAKYELVLNTQP